MFSSLLAVALALASTPQKLRVSVLVAVLAAPGCAPVDRSAETATPAPRAAATRAALRATPSPVVAATHVAVTPPAPVRPRAAATPIPSPSATIAGVHASLPVPAAADPRPYILSASVNPAVVRSGTTVSAIVRTTAGVASVVAYAAGTSMAVPRVGIGRFAGSTTLPSLPAFVHGVFPVTFVARDRSGRSTQTAISVTVP